LVLLPPVWITCQKLPFFLSSAFYLPLLMVMENCADLRVFFRHVITLCKRTKQIGAFVWLVVEYKRQQKLTGAASASEEFQ
jgi:hypothetical protein